MFNREIMIIYSSTGQNYEQRQNYEHVYLIIFIDNIYIILIISMNINSNIIVFILA